MAEFKNKEEYEKWKANKEANIAEKLQSQRDEQLRLIRLKEEEATQQSLWICPKCLTTNNIANSVCQCGYQSDKILFPYFKGNVSAGEIYKSVINELNGGNQDNASFLATYLFRRFPKSEESSQLSKLIDFNPNLIICPTCKNEISLNATTCPKCGEPITEEQKISASSNVDLSRLIEEEQTKTEIIKKAGGVQGFFFGIIMAVVVFGIGMVLSLTAIGFLIGAPMVIVSFVLPFYLAFVPMTYLVGKCPYCNVKIQLPIKSVGVVGGAKCPICKKRMVIKDNKLLKVTA